MNKFNIQEAPYIKIASSGLYCLQSEFKHKGFFSPICMVSYQIHQCVKEGLRSPE